MRSGRIVVLALAWALAGAASAGMVSGTAVKEGGTPFAGLKVRLYLFDGGVGGAKLTDSAVTDAQGAYRFQGLGEGLWQVRANLDGYFPSQGAARLDDSEQTTDADVVLRQGKGVTAKGSVTGVIRDAGSAAAVAGARVVLVSFPEDEGTDPTPVDTVFTSAGGRYLFDSVAAGGNYELRVTAVGFEAQSGGVLSVTGMQTETMGFELVGQGSVILARPRQRVRVTGAELAFPPAARPRSLSVVRADGALRFTVAVPAGADRIPLPRGGAGERLLYLISP